MADPQDIIEKFEERIALMTIDGEQPVHVAVRHAYNVQRELHGRSNLPQHLVDAWAKVMKEFQCNQLL
jgi:hypothetical protein